MILEAAASGLPVIAVAEGGPAALVENRHTRAAHYARPGGPSGTPVVLAPPSLFALVLGVLLGVVLVRSGALDPLRAMNSSRKALTL